MVPSSDPLSADAFRVSLDQIIVKINFHDFASQFYAHPLSHTLVRYRIECVSHLDVAVQRDFGLMPGDYLKRRHPLGFRLFELGWSESQKDGWEN